MNHELHQRGYENAVVKFVEKMYTQQFNAWASNGEFERINPDVSFVDMCRRLQSKQGKGYFLITVNPAYDTSQTWSTDEDPWEDLREGVMKLMNQRIFQGNAWWAYEQRSEDVDDAYGPHVHIMIEAGSSKKSDLVKRVTSTMKRCLHVPLNVDVRPCDRNTIKYIAGIKDDAKHVKVDADRWLRNHHGINDVCARFGDDDSLSDLLGVIPNLRTNIKLNNNLA